jgi:hypothetical protein
MTLRKAAAAVLLPICAWLPAACSNAPEASHVSTNYRGKLPDDVMVEASTTVLVLTKDAVIAPDCSKLTPAIASNDAAAIDQAVNAGSAARLPANVRVYTPPFSSDNPQAFPMVVTDDKFAGRLCTPDAYRVDKS